MYLLTKKQSSLIPSIFLCKSSWDFSMKSKCDLITQNWQIIFQISDFKENHFLDLLDGNYISVKPMYSKDRPWLKLVGHLNSLCARVTRVITNHVSIREYYLRFFPRENFSCLCGNYSIESRCYILYKCRRFNNYWNPNRAFLDHFIVFLKYNPRAFFFNEDITW